MQSSNLEVTMANIIKGNQDGENGGNESYTIPGRGVVSRPQLVREVEHGKHPNFSTYERDGVKYVRGNPDSRTNNNVNDD
jgi:hypothetical protein